MTKATTQYWLVKTEPTTYSFDDLIADEKQITPWEGVRNYKARNYLRNDMKRGDLAFFYHSSCPEPSIMGIVKVVRAGYPDPTQFDPKSPYYDPKSSPAHPRWYRVDMQYKKKFTTPLSLQSIKANPKLATMILVHKGNRLSVMPVTPQEWQSVLAMVK